MWATAVVAGSADEARRKAERTTRGWQAESGSLKVEAAEGIGAETRSETAESGSTRPLQRTAASSEFDGSKDAPANEKENPGPPLPPRLSPAPAPLTGKTPDEPARPDVIAVAGGARRTAHFEPCSFCGRNLFLDDDGDLREFLSARHGAAPSCCGHCLVTTGNVHSPRCNAPHSPAGPPFRDWVQGIQPYFTAPTSLALASEDPGSAPALREHEAGADERDHSSMEEAPKMFGTKVSDLTVTDPASELRDTAGSPPGVCGFHANDLLYRNGRLTELEQGTLKEYSEVKGDGATPPPSPQPRSATNYAYHDQEDIHRPWLVPGDRGNDRHLADVEQGTTAAFPEATGDGAVRIDLKDVDLATVATAQQAHLIGITPATAAKTESLPSVGAGPARSCGSQPRRRPERRPRHGASRLPTICPGGTGRRSRAHAACSARKVHRSPVQRDRAAVHLGRDLASPAAFRRQNGWQAVVPR